MASNSITLESWKVSTTLRLKLESLTNLGHFLLFKAKISKYLHINSTKQSFPGLFQRISHVFQERIVAIIAIFE